MGLISGSGYSAAGIGQWVEGSSKWTDYILKPGDVYTTQATIDPGVGLTSFSATGGNETYTYTASSQEAMLSDGILGWGRWLTGNANEAGSLSILEYSHYVIGMPTPMDDMAALHIGNRVGTYALQGYTYPTAFNSSNGLTSLTIQGISGSMTANFGTSQVMGLLNVHMGSNTYNSNWFGSLGGTAFAGAGNVTTSGTDCYMASCVSHIFGFFSGSNASRAGLIYQFSGTEYGEITGAAAFRQTGLTP